MLRRLPAAITDVDEIWFYIAQDNLAAASRMVERITDATARLEAFPASGTPRPDIHPAASSIAVAPYIIYYPIETVTVAIVRVVNAARDAGAVTDTLSDGVKEPLTSAPPTR